MKDKIITGLRRYLRKHKITYAMIADRMCVSEATVVNWLKHKKISLDKFDELLVMFDIKFDCVYGDDDSGVREKKNNN